MGSLQMLGDVVSQKRSACDPAWQNHMVLSTPDFSKYPCCKAYFLGLFEVKEKSKAYF